MRKTRATSRTMRKFGGKVANPLRPLGIADDTPAANTLAARQTCDGNETASSAVVRGDVNWCRAKLLHVLAQANHQGVLAEVIDELLDDAGETSAKMTEALRQTGWVAQEPPEELKRLPRHAIRYLRRLLRVTPGTRLQQGWYEIPKTSNFAKRDEALYRRVEAAAIAAGFVRYDSGHGWVTEIGHRWAATE